jgi:hypothetical protein
MNAFSPDPQRADGEIDDEPGGDARQVGQQVEQAEPGQDLHDADVERERAERDEIEVDEPARRQPHRTERPHLVQHVVVGGGRLDRHQGRGQQRQPGPPVQGGEYRVVDDDPTGADGQEPAYPGPQPDPVAVVLHQRHKPNRAHSPRWSASLGGADPAATFGLPRKGEAASPRFSSHPLAR